MNGKKILTTVVAGLTAFACSLTVLTGCGPDHEHSYNYTVTTPATCVSEGARHGVCRICNKEVDEVIPVTPDAHVYGEWEITEVPTATAGGKAKRVCGLDNYVLEVELPKLSDVATEDDKDKSGKYDEKDIVTVVEPRALHEGEIQYKYKHDSGDIVFSVVVPARGVGTVADAIDALTEKHDEVRSGEGAYAYERKTMLNEPDLVTPTSYRESTSFNYQFGDNYTHSYESGNGTDKWCSLDENGDLFAFTSTNGGATLTEEQDENFLQGPLIPIIGTDMNGYGAEGLLKSLYAIGENNNNKDFEERYSETEGYYFRFGYISRNTEGMQTLAIVEVTFNLTELYTLDKLMVEVNAYVNMPGAEPDELETDPVTGELVPIKTWDMDEEGIGRLVVKEKTGYRFIVDVNVTQKTKEQAEKDGDPVPENPYSREGMMFSDFDLAYLGNVIDGDTPLNISANALINLRLTNPVPETVNYNYDTLSIYLVDNGREILLPEDMPDNADERVNLMGYYNVQTRDIYIRSHLVGELKLKIASAYVSKYITLNVAEIAPTTLCPSIYEYNDTGYVWRDSLSASPTTISATVRVGQPLRFTVSPQSSESSYVHNGWYVRLIQKNDGGWADTEDATVSDPQTVDGREVREFVATKPGTYRVQFRTTFEGATTGGLVNITVEDIPDMASSISGTYSANVVYPRRGTVKVEVSISGNQGTAIITDSEGSTENLSFTLTQTATSVSIQSAHSGLADLGYVLSFNEAWRLIVTHPSIEDEFETVVLNKQS